MTQENIETDIYILGMLTGRFRVGGRLGGRVGSRVGGRDRVGYGRV